ncbi:hypothetical protein [Arthrobacter sp. PAMC 25486]|uniref:hypothetical protein n=1 Tax=Arthrobacter sp. PAMC 25486 TaxID=1494608 RepID=UPI00057143F8|nr:hypothetical protein [Arthrobacter sp. PAMC 25486]
MAVHPALFRDDKKLLQLLNTPLSGVPRPACKSTVEIEQLQRPIRRSKRAKFWWIAVPAAVAAITVSGMDTVPATAGRPGPGDGAGQVLCRRRHEGQGPPA